ncbi:MAG: DNA polymerase III subunit gamma/tau [Cetobacterium somerae]|uniref:DNA polymerase III subunit gamma/tau n=1 Tax=Cetobacterium somerae ATCC BAA-474 TaxID=1319815 RepID=U7VET6_9FUSO|nr:DNA polymerase III subunit gamma/tau [Cetobacterium somerae]ERT70031.1 DNA polymerase III, subunit gamma and tau [Cetobacterium somerae ATCC BAA-474]MCQ9626660.1 DNA polymerase III subunit gamma/tau [Cetobacterium somerae]WVJ02091.1 DNA polymerase III subunit gamma/tau [Cetobacterium somerae]
MHVTLYRKYRPKGFEEIAGEQEIVQTLKNSLKSNRLAHAYLFTGPRGVGKTSIARLMAKGVNCLTNGITDTPCNVCENCKEISMGNFLDLIEIDAASNRGIDEIRQLKEKINYSPTKGRKKVYIIDEVHMLTKEAFNALLKTLEEPPEHVLFILATTEPDKILPTIISRCQRYDFKSVNYRDMREKLLYIVDSEGYKIDEPSLVAIYEASGGSMRDSISILERLMINTEEKNIVIEKTEDVLGITPLKTIDLFIEAIENKNQSQGIELLEDIWKNSIDIELFFKDLAKRAKDRIIKGDLETEKGLEIIDTIYDILSKFRYEEDKRLIGYVILNRLTERKEKEVIVEKIIEKVQEVDKDVVDISENDVNQEIVSKVTYDEVKKSWNKIIEESKKVKMTFGAFLIKAYFKDFSNNTLTIGFPEDQGFAKNMMETEPYRTLFLDVARKVLKSKIMIKYELQEVNKNKDRGETEDFSKKIIDFFGGEII